MEDRQYAVHTSVMIFIIFEFKHFSHKTAVCGDHDDLLLGLEIITVLQQYNTTGQGPIAFIEPTWRAWKNKTQKHSRVFLGYYKTFLYCYCYTP
jgi:hypothetical protein